MRPKSIRRPAVFLDRDGTILNETGYLGDPKKMKFYSAGIEGLKILSQIGVPLFVISNQSGIGRGYFTRRQYEMVNRAFLSVLRKKGIRIAGVYICPHLPTAGCDCRKPKIGLLKKAARRHRIDLKSSFVVGDQLRDIQLAERAGCAGVLVLTGKGKYYRHQAKMRSHVSSNLVGAAKWIKNRLQGPKWEN